MLRLVHYLVILKSIGLLSTAEKKCDIIGTRLRTPHFIPFRLYGFAFALHVLVGRGR